MAEREQLPIPDAAKQDLKSFELLRVWIAHNGQHVSLRAGVWQDPAAWGVMICDLMQHIANSYHQDQGFDRSKTLQRIRAGLEAELSAPTDQPTGQ
ncbi:MAG: DUF5076 domain-containing protein [Planctomycetia bacterium]|nr:DUF5076 domain-containing protein [Planctomycetia bacterium]